MVAQGTTLAGRYRLDTRIGAGGMGEVWRGEDVVLARTVAVKVLLPGRTDDPGFVARFQGEARAMATINHAGVVDVYDYGVHQIAGAGATAYLVMKFVDGEPLDRLLARLGRIAPEPAMELIAQAASALQAVHEQGIVHRDVKPGNLLVQRDGTLVITDFGIARADVASRLTDAGMVLGTAAYCAPEQAEGAPVTPAVDIYALGVVAYECLVGQRPFDGDSPVTIALKHIREAPPPLPVEIPPAVRALVERALSKDPARRFPSAAAMAAEARRSVSPEGHAPPLAELAPVTGATMAAPQPPQPSSDTGPGLDPVTVATPRRSRRAAKARRRGGLVAGIAVVAVLGVGAGAVALTGMVPEATPVTPSGDKGSESAKADPTIPHPARTTRTRPPKTQPARPTIKEDPDPEPTRDPEPSRTPSPTATKPTSSPSPSPTPSKSQLKKEVVPSVLDLFYNEAKKRIEGAGFKLRVINNTTGDLGTCPKVSEQDPAAGESYEKGRVVTITTVSDICPTQAATGTPTPSTTLTPKP
ncbi:protein kinase [Nonomuraea sp. NPDC046570]|uniref:serine/threonine protein kinase n=1 Tax=Nonomuraea sp. NPDC046570 TaxID=3155255 RepID=UPI0034110FA7